MFYICIMILIICFSLTVYRSRYMDSNHKLYNKLGIIIYLLLAFDFALAIFS